MNTAINFLGTVWYVLCYLATGGESGGYDSDDDDDDYHRRHDSDSDSSGHRVPGQYLPPAEHNGYGSLADFSIPHSSDDGNGDTFQMY
jgi:hypothetical protein